MSPIATLVLDVVLSLAIGLFTNLCVALWLKKRGVAPRKRWGLVVLPFVIIFVFAVLSLCVNPPLVTAPDVTGEWEAVATDQLKHDYFRVRLKPDSSSVETGKVSKQHPRGGTRCRWRTEVTIRVGVPVVYEVPDVVGLWKDEAVARLAEHFRPSVIESVSAVERGKVYQQAPRGGARCSESTEVRIRVSLGSSPKNARTDSSSRHRQTVVLFAVTSPHDGETVGPTVAVRGTTPYRDLSHYVVVTPVGTGGDWIESDQVDIGPGASWECSMTFQSKYAGIGKRFHVWCLATERKLTVGPLQEEPADSKRSRGVTVVRGE